MNRDVSDFKRVVLRVRVRALERTGAQVEIIDQVTQGAEKLSLLRQRERFAWLPYRELSYDKSFDYRDEEAVQRILNVNADLLVVVIGELASNRHQPIVSLAVLENDPFETRVPGWIELQSPKVMVVRDATSRSFIYGSIEVGVEARIERCNWEKYLGGKASDPFFAPQADDRLIGIPIKMDLRRRIVDLSPASVLLNPHGDSAGELDTWPQSAVSTALNLLSDAQATELRPITVDDKPIIDTFSPCPTELPSRQVLVLDDEPDVAQSIGEFLLAYGFSVDYCHTTAEASALISKTEKNGTNIDGGYQAKDEFSEYDVAIIDIDLIEDPTSDSDEIGGILFAKELLEKFTQCKVVLMSGRPTPGKSILCAEALRDISVAAFLEKPIEGNTLLECLGRLRSFRTREGRDLLQPPPQAIDAVQKVKNESSSCEVMTNDRGKGGRLHASLMDLKDDLDADSVILFCVDPLSRETTIKCCVGRMPANWEAYNSKLCYSPVADVSFDCRDRNTVLCDNDVYSRYRAHRYLICCYSAKQDGCTTCDQNRYMVCRDHSYKSCLAVRVRGGSCDPMAYALFAFSGHKNAFDTNIGKLQIQLAAEKAGRILFEDRELKLKEAEHSSLMAGKSACSVGHDLRNILQHGLNLETIQKTIAELGVGTPLTQEFISKVQTLVANAARGLAGAEAVASNYCELARPEMESETDFCILDIVGTRGSAKQAVTKAFEDCRIERQATAVSSGEISTIIRARKNAITRVFQSLLLNSAQQIALRGIIPGAVRIDLSCETVESEGRSKRFLNVDVLDTGPGIHWRGRERIFEPRFTSRSDGAGMGLYIAMEELAQCGGSIALAESILGIGTRMRIRFPVVSREDS